MAQRRSGRAYRDAEVSKEQQTRGLSGDLVLLVLTALELPFEQKSQ